MKYRKLGNSDLEVSAIGLGGNNFGWWADEESSLAVIGKALELGINFFDTANVYGEGKSEEWLGRVLKEHRSKVVIATKFGYEFVRPGGAADTIKESVEGSLKRLGSDYIDLLQMHFPDQSTPIEETMKALDELVKEGKVRAVGCSNFSSWELADAIWTSKANDFTEFVSLQSPYNLINRQLEVNHIPCCVSHNVGIVTYTPLGGGFLTGKYKRGQDNPDATRFAKVPVLGALAMQENNYNTVEKLQAFVEKSGHKLSELAIAWLLTRPAVSTVIVGATKPEQVEANVKSIEWELTGDELNGIDNITQAHQGIGINTPGTQKTSCPWCSLLTKIPITENDIINGVWKFAPTDGFECSDNKTAMCDSCFAPFTVTIK